MRSWKKLSRVGGWSEIELEPISGPRNLGIISYHNLQSVYGRNLTAGVRMDQKLALLSALRVLEESHVALSEYTIRHLRIIFSQFAEEVISVDEYQELLDILQEEDYIVQGNDKIQVTTEGGALVDAIGESVIGQTSFARLKGMLNDYSKNPRKYIQAVNEHLSQLHEMREEKIKPVDRSRIRVVGLLLEIRQKEAELLLHRFKLDRSLMRNEAGIDKEINYASRKFIDARKVPIIAYRDRDELCVIGLSRLANFTLYGQQLDPFAVESVKRERVHGWNLLLARLFLEAKLAELGYLRARWPGQTFIKYRDFSQEQTNVGILRESESINIDYTELNDNHIFVWIETFTSPNKRVLDFINERVGDTSDEQAILNQLGKLKLRIIPSGSEVKLTAVLPAADLRQGYVPGTNQTYAGYWENTYGIKFSQNVQLRLVVKLNQMSLHFPAEMVYIDKWSLERFLGASQVRKPKPEKPPVRFRKIQELSRAINNLTTNQANSDYEVHLSEYAPTLERLCDLGGFEKAIRIKQPALKFYGGAVSLDPLDVFEGGYGPICGRKNITITHLVLPQDGTDAEINGFLSGLQRTFDRHRLGRLLREKDLQIERYDPEAGNQKLEEKIRSLTKARYEHGIALAVTSGNDNDSYYMLKRLLPLTTQTAFQNVTRSTFEQIVADSFPGERYLALQILIKSLKPGEAIWHLNNAAGLLDQKTFFVGIGFSRNPWQKKVSKCAAVLHDAFGGKVSWQIFSTPDERTITKAWFDTLLHKIKDAVEQERPARLVFYRKGEMAETELEAVQASLENFTWTQPINCTFISVLDVGNFRFYVYDQDEKRAKNLPAGYGIIINRREAFLSTSNYDDRALMQGTIIPIRLRLEIGDDDILDILKEYHDLTYLNWPAPRTTGKYPLVLTIAERFAELIRENISDESLIYLDL